MCQKIKRQLSSHAGRRKIKYVTVITKHHILSFWQHNKQAHWAKESVDTVTIAKRDIITALQLLYSTVWVRRNKLTELNQCDRVNDCFSLLNSGCGAAGPQGPQVTVRLSVISAQSHSISSPHFTTIMPWRLLPWHQHSTTVPGLFFVIHTLSVTTCIHILFDPSMKMVRHVNTICSKHIYKW